MPFTFYPADCAHFPDTSGSETHAPGFALDGTHRCFRTGEVDESPRWVIAANDSASPSFSIGEGSPAGKPAGIYNERPYWEVSGSYVFYSLSGVWIFFNSLREPRAYLGPDEETWVGDGWYEFERAPNDTAAQSVGSIPAGTNLNAIAVEDRNSATGPAATPSWPHWERRASSPGAAAPIGYYDPDGGASGVIRLGSLCFTDSEGRTWLQTADGNSYNAADLTARWRALYGLWIIGSRVRGGSWAQSATDPSAKSGAIFTWMKWESGSSPEQDTEKEPLLWTFAGLASSGEQTTIYMAEASAWR